MKKVLLGVFLLASTLALAQDKTNFGVRVGIGYGWSDSFKDRSGNSLSVSGPELTLSVPFLTQSGFQFAFEPSYFLAGRIVSKGTQADIFHFTLTGTHSLTQSSYVKVGVGFAHGSAQQGLFASQDGIVGQAGIGFDASSWLGGHNFAPTIEANYFAAGHGQLRGFFVGVTAAF